MWGLGGHLNLGITIRPLPQIPCGQALTPTLKMHASPLVLAKDLCFGYGERRILDGVTFEVPRGKVTALMGASGGGKTTVLRLISGQYRAQSGQLLFDGQDVGAMAQPALYLARRRMGMLFQFGALFTDLSVFDNVAFPLASTPTWARS